MLFPQLLEGELSVNLAERREGVLIIADAFLLDCHQHSLREGVGRDGFVGVMGL